MNGKIPITISARMYMYKARIRTLKDLQTFNKS